MAESMTSLEHCDITMQGFTPHTSFAMQNIADKGTILNSCCLLLLAVSLPKRECTAANRYFPSCNNQLCTTIKPSTDHKVCTHCGIDLLVIHN